MWKFEDQCPRAGVTSFFCKGQIVNGSGCVSQVWSVLHILFFFPQPFKNVRTILSIWALPKQSMGCSLSTSSQEHGFPNLFFSFQRHVKSRGSRSHMQREGLGSLQGAGPSCLQTSLEPWNLGNVSRLPGGSYLI